MIALIKSNVLMWDIKVEMFNCLVKGEHASGKHVRAMYTP